MNTSKEDNFGIYASYFSNKYGNEKEFGEKDLESVENIREQLGPMKKGVKISCNIPVCGHQESKNIYRCLSCFTKQNPATYSTFEVNLLVNSPESGDYSWEETKSEIERFKKDHPEIIVNVAYFRFQGEADIGLLRSHLNDARMSDVTDPNNHLFASFDADMVDMPGEYMTRLPRLFQKPEHQLLAARFKDSDTLLCYFPAHKIAWSLCRLLGEKRRKPIGGNMVFRVSAYQKTGGYKKTHGIAGEDSALGKAIQKKLGGMRQGNSSVTVTTDARRKIDGLLNNGGQKPEHGFWHSKGADGSVTKNPFGAVEKYREVEYTEDLSLLKHITSDETGWNGFLSDLAHEMKESLVNFIDTQIKGDTLGKYVDDEDDCTPKKWKQAMRILGIEKWNIKIDLDKPGKKVTNINLQIIQAEELKEKLKRFILSKEQKV